jgi:hypothetical protein
MDDLKTDWQRQELEVDELQLRLRASRWRTRLVLVLEILWTLFGLVMGLLYAVIAWRWRDLLFALSALTILLIVPPFFVELLLLRLRSLGWVDRTPEGTRWPARASRARSFDCTS